MTDEILSLMEERRGYKIKTKGEDKGEWTGSGIHNLQKY